jgi:hypothetical protein
MNGRINLIFLEILINHFSSKAFSSQACCSDFRVREAADMETRSRGNARKNSESTEQAFQAGVECENRHLEAHERGFMVKSPCAQIYHDGLLTSGRCTVISNHDSAKGFGSAVLSRRKPP